MQPEPARNSHVRRALQRPRVPASAPPKCRPRAPRRTGSTSPSSRPTWNPEGDISPDRFLDRELSWLAFNSRVLELAEDPDLHLLERVGFLSIFASNLDEFFMVRVAGLKRRIATGLAVPSPAGLSPVRGPGTDRRGGPPPPAAPRPGLRRTDPRRHWPTSTSTSMHWDELDDAAKHQLSAMFAEKVFPILTPLAVDPAHPFPYISGLSLNLAVVVRNPVSDKELFARLKVPDQLPRLISIDGPRAGAIAGRVARFIALEEVIAVHLDQLFAGMEVLEHHTFRVTRNEDVEVEEDDAENLLQALEKELLRRRFGPPVRLEVTNDINPQHPGAADPRTRRGGVRGLFAFRPRWTSAGCPSLPASTVRTCITPSTCPHTSRYLNESETSKAANVFAAMRRRDILLHHPYDSFSTSVQAFLEQAAADPKVQAIKQTLYRTSGDSPIVDALIDAAEAGKQVLALVEIKARFDEQANISWARKLEQAGVHVVYGIVGLKTHCKLSLVVRQEVDGLRRYCHIGTGNYHPRTARYYEDLGLLTANEQVGEDLSKLFNQLSGYAPKSTFKRLLVAPALGALRTDRPDRDRNPQRPCRPCRAGADQGQLHGGRGHHRFPLPRLPGRREGGRHCARHLLAAPGRPRAQREHHGPLRPGPLPGALPRVRLRQRRRPGGLHRLGRHDAPQPGPPGGGPGAADQRRRHRRTSWTCCAATWTRTRPAGTWTTTAKWTRHHLDDDGTPLDDVQSWLLASRSRQRACAGGRSRR